MKPTHFLSLEESMNGGTYPLIRVYGAWESRICVYHQDALIDAKTTLYFSFLTSNDRRLLAHLDHNCFEELRIIRKKLAKSKPIGFSK
jgi:hypothetical protein